MAKLKILSGKSAGKELEIEHLAVNLGRDSSNEIVLNDDNVSRMHAQVRKEGEKYEVIDQGSTNGTLVNGRHVTSCELKNGDTIQVGEVEIGFSLGEALVQEAVQKEAQAVAPQAAPQESIGAKAGSVKFSIASGDMQKLAKLQDQFGAFLMDKTVALGQALNFKGILLKVVELKPASGGIIDSNTAVDVTLTQEAAAKPAAAGGADQEKAPRQYTPVGQLVKAAPIKRLLAYIIDIGVMIVLSVAVAILVSLVRLQLLALLMFVSPVYFLLRDGLFKAFPGQSLGKKVLKIMVINVNTKQPIGMFDSFKRQIFMWIPILNFVECIMILVDPEGRRFGDKVFNTMVIEAE